MKVNLAVMCTTQAVVKIRPEKSLKKDAVAFSVESDWLRGLHEFSAPLTKQSKANA